MASNSLHDLKKMLLDKNPKELMEICFRLAKYKKENKELLDYILNFSENEIEFIEKAKLEIQAALIFSGGTTYKNAVKIIRKSLKVCNKNIKYSGIKQTEIELLIFFCKSLKETNVNLSDYQVIDNLYHRQIEKINKALEKIHPDLQFDYQQEIESL